jgi:hypothetical protein
MTPGIIKVEDIWDQMLERFNNPDKYSVEPPKKGENYFSVLQRIKKYYQLNEKDILEQAKKNPYHFYRSSPMNWYTFFSPLEEQVWQVIKSVGRVPLYPQYPVLNYFLDFANPHFKIAVEADGKQWHNEEKDRIRDENLVNAGWKVFRVGSRDIFNIVDIDDLDFYYEADREKYEDYLMNTIEGVIESIKQIYFNRREPNHLFFDTYYRSLHKHRLVDFDL